MSEKKSTSEVVITTVFVIALVSIAFRSCGHKPTDAELERMDHAYEQGR